MILPNSDLVDDILTVGIKEEGCRYRDKDDNESTDMAMATTTPQELFRARHLLLLCPS